MMLVWDIVFECNLASLTINIFVNLSYVVEQF